MEGRLQRRLEILKGKRRCAFDADQLWLERAWRGRVARRLRAHLRRLDPVVLVTPRWSAPLRFLDDLALDLQVGTPKIDARLLSVNPLAGRTANEAWTWLLHAFTEVFGFGPEGPIAQAVNRVGFKSVLQGILRRSIRGPRRALLINGIEHLPVAARDDLLRTYEDHCEEVASDRRLVLLVAGSVDGPRFDIRGGIRAVLRDYGPAEANETLAEYVDVKDWPRVHEVIAVTGGVPALIDRIGSEAESGRRLALDREEVWAALGPYADDIRRAIEIATSKDELGERLDELSRGGPKPEEPRDAALLQAGLLVPDPNRPGRVRARAPLFNDLSRGTNEIFVDGRRSPV